MARKFHVYGVPGWHATPKAAAAGTKAADAPKTAPLVKAEAKPKEA